jgi:hypothetical protein
MIIYCGLRLGGEQASKAVAPRRPTSRTKIANKARRARCGSTIGARRRSAIEPLRRNCHSRGADYLLSRRDGRWERGSASPTPVLLYTGQRVRDVARMRRQDVSGGCITVAQQKTGTFRSQFTRHSRRQLRPNRTAA